MEDDDRLWIRQSNQTNRVKQEEDLAKKIKEEAADQSDSDSTPPPPPPLPRLPTQSTTKAKAVNHVSLPMMG